MSNMPTINDILRFLEDRKVIQLAGFQNDILIKRPAPISDAQPGDISFYGATAKNPLDLLAQTGASLLIVDKNIPIDSDKLSDSDVQAIVLRDNARLDALGAYNSQKGKSYANEEFIRNFARTRGVQIGSRYAEAFEVIRWVMR